MSIIEDIFNEPQDADDDRAVFAAMVDEISSKNRFYETNPTRVATNNKLSAYAAEATREYMRDNLFTKSLVNELVTTGRAMVRTTYVEPEQPKPVEKRGPQLRDLIFED